MPETSDLLLGGTEDESAENFRRIRELLEEKGVGPDPVVYVPSGSSAVTTNNGVNIVYELLNLSVGNWATVVQVGSTSIISWRALDVSNVDITYGLEARYNEGHLQLRSNQYLPGVLVYLVQRV